MHIARVTPAEHSEFLALVNAEIRPDRAKTNAWDDFPLALGAGNLDWMLAIRDNRGHLVAGLAALIRSFRTNWGNLQVAGLGSVVTRPDRRGRGYSTALQNEMIRELEGKKIPLAVLWTDQPEIYAGRGFRSAGWEAHVGFDGADLGGAPTVAMREYRPQDAAAVEALYLQHRWVTVREPGDSDQLYAMPGTRGLVAVDGSDRPVGAVFCGKGADFPDYVTEWSGPFEILLALLAKVRQEGWAHRLIAPPGEEATADGLLKLGAEAFAVASGQWRIVSAGPLDEAARSAGHGGRFAPGDETALLGDVDAGGRITPGALQVAVWGFDSV